MPSFDDWKRALLTLDDEPFFELIKNHLGKVQTPYHKPSIINGIEKFLSSPETRTRILCMMGDKEIAIVSFILRSPGSDYDHLYRFFQDTHSALRFQSLIENLQERLIIYRDEAGLFFINPVLQAELEQLIRDEPVTVKSFDAPSAEPWFTEELLIAFIAFLQDNPSPGKQSGELKKSVRTAFSEVFPQHDGDNRFQLYLDTLKFLGIIHDHGDRYSVSREQLESFISLEKFERSSVFLAGITAAVWHESPPRRAFAAGRTIIEALKKNTTQPLAYEREPLVKQLSTELSRENQRFTPRRISQSLDRLIFAGYMDEEEGFVRPLGFQTASEPEDSAPMILQPSFEILLPPEASGAARLFAALYCRLQRFDRISHYGLEQQHFTASLQSTGEDAKIPQLLARACGQKVPQNVIMTLRGWMERVQQIEIATGTVVKVVPEIIPVIEKEFSSMIVQTLAPGVYFVKPEKLSPFITRWKALGYADPGEIRNLLSVADNESTFTYTMNVDTLPEIPTEPANAGARNTPESESGTDCNRITAELRAHLNSLEVNPEQRRELEAKINKKLLLFPQQVTPEVCRIGRIEARGIDFHAKLRIIEDVLEHREDLLEIESPEISDGSALVYPLKLTKDPGDPSLTALVLPEEIEQTFKIRRASRIRKRRRSVFY
ncbi:hypothetical protein [Marispirochaeta sp.]|jgi:hypothetical protein|uniref:hypothetical protein n=1 Tax=Marispirochaeta sp. TaxID=2038653 RepID=UPI0029C74239|nr:hypothetical protein [Marispirochaeta sp.]